MRKTTRIYAQNAYDYCREQGWFKGDGSTPDFNIAPILNDFAIECKVNSGTVMFHFRSTDSRDEMSEPARESGAVRWEYFINSYAHPSIHQRMPAKDLLDNPLSRSSPLAYYLLRVDEKGRRLGPIDWYWADGTPGDMLEQQLGEMVHTAKDLLIASLFVLNLMHCRNVHMVELEPTKRERRMHDKHGRKLYRYHVLKVATGKGAYETSGDTSGIKMSQHICRGHFRTYSDDALLFGKYSGTFWVPAHVRGNRELGVVDKDYRIAPVEGNTA